jgi:hypothetical protein
MAAKTFPDPVAKKHTQQIVLEKMIMERLFVDIFMQKVMALPMF